MTDLTLDLDGSDWLLREALGLTWQWHVGAQLPGDVPANNAADAADAVSRSPGWLPATVPGSVVTDLWRAGEVPSPYVGRQSRAAEWVATRSWVYRRTVDLPELDPRDRVVLELDGVDPGATVVWDGEVVGTVEGLYRQARIDLTARLRAEGDRGGSRHRLAVVVHPAVDTQPQVGRTDRVRVHAPRMTHGWDFCPRLPHQGVWRSARIVVGPMHLTGVVARTELTGPDGLVHVRAEVETSGQGQDPVHLEVTVHDPSGEEVARRVVGVVDGVAVTAVQVAAPRRWWPRGHGEQPLYVLGVRAVSASGAWGTPAWCRAVGFRQVRMVPNPGAPPEALPYTAEVNGRPVELLGWNWVPAQAQYGTVRTEQLEHLLDLAVGTGAVLLRVWGGGLVESEELFAACDRRGLLVWQELSQSSSGMQSAPASDDAFVAHLREQARLVVPPRTHHPSLLMWGGGNELDLDGVPLDEESSPALAALREEVAHLDPGRHWVPTSPTGPVFHNRLDVLAGRPDDLHDVHGPWEHQGLTGHPALYDAGTCLAHTEFGVEGMTNLRTLEALVPAQHRWPPGRENAVYRHLGEWWNNLELVQECFGGRLRTLVQVQRASQHLQATGLAYAVEADRRRAPRCSMVVPWQLNESFPNAWCTSAVDHRGDAKAVLHAVRRAFAPDRVAVQAPTTAWGDSPEASCTVWVWSRGGVGAGSRVTVRLLAEDGDVRVQRSWDVGPVRSPVAVGTLTVPTAGLPRGVVVWDVEWTDAQGRLVDRELALASTTTDLSPLLDLAVARVSIETAAEGEGRWSLRVRHRGGPLVPGLRVLDARDVTEPGWVVTDDDPRPLLPGGVRTIAVHRRDCADASAPLPVRLDAWNLPTTELTLG